MKREVSAVEERVLRAVLAERREYKRAIGGYDWRKWEAIVLRLNRAGDALLREREGKR